MNSSFCGTHSFYHSLIQNQKDRAVVSVNGIWQHTAVNELIAQAVRNGRVVDTPAFVAATGTGAVTPPAIRHLLRVFVAKGIGHAGVKPAIHPGPFVGQEASCVFIPNRVVNVDGSMSNVIIADHNEVGAGLPQSLNIVVKIPAETLASPPAEHRRLCRKGNSS